MDIHKQLKQIRKDAGMTQTELAKLSKGVQKQVSEIEGGRDCNISTMRRLLRVLGYEVAAVRVSKPEGGKLGE